MGPAPSSAGRHDDMTHDSATASRRAPLAGPCKRPRKGGRPRAKSPAIASEVDCEALRDTSFMASANVELVRSIYAAWERSDLSSVEWAHPEIAFVRVDGLHRAESFVRRNFVGQQLIVTTRRR
jgi:hypothetical protein